MEPSQVKPLSPEEPNRYMTNGMGTIRSSKPLSGVGDGFDFQCASAMWLKGWRHLLDAGFASAPDYLLSDVALVVEGGDDFLLRRSQGDADVGWIDRERKRRIAVRLQLSLGCGDAGAESLYEAQDP